MAAFSIVDVFNTTAFRGNPLAIVYDEEAKLTTTQMQLLARQFNLSETTFICSPTQGDTPIIHLRSFLPNGREVLGIGHNILGAWWELAANGRLQQLQRKDLTGARQEVEESVFRQRLGETVSEVRINRESVAESQDKGVRTSVVIRQVTPQLHSVHPDVSSLAASVGIAEADIQGGSNGELRPQVASTSTTRHLLVPVASIEALNRIRVDRDKLLRQLSLVDEKAFGIYFFTRSTEGEGRYVARFFSPGMSGEDPATGSAAGPLARYLYSHGELKTENGRGRIEVLQGLQTGRECWIEVEVTITGEGDNEEVNVDLRGSGVRVANGVIAIPDKGIVSEQT